MIATPVLTVATVALGIGLAVVWRRWRQAARAEFIRSYVFPRGLFEQLRKAHPTLSQKDCQLVARGLRQFFLAHLASGRKFVSMPSQVADDLWHALILYTRHYQVFCDGAFGRFLHHTPAVVLGPHRQNNAGLRRTWFHACKEENIDPRKPLRLPLLFALDQKLGIAGGFVYAPDCSALRDRGNGTVHCGGDFSDGSIDGSTDGFGDASDSSGSGSDGGGDGGGCGGGD